MSLRRPGWERGDPPSSPVEDAIDRIASFTRIRADADGTPGVTLAVTDAERTLATLAFGVADVRSRAPVVPEDLFQTGSMGKAFAAVVALQLAGEGRLDLDAPVTTYLPWFEVPSRFPPITLHHLLSHTAGISSGSLGFPDARAEVWALRRTEAAWAPGTRFHYSNAGYSAVGLAIASVTGRPFREVLRERVLDPLGMHASTSWISSRDRARLVTPHVPLRADRPYRPGDALAPATWFEDDRADGSMCSTAGEMAAFLRLLLRGGDGVEGAVLRAGAFDRMTSPHIADGSGSYGYGIGLVGSASGGATLSHGGDTVGYVAHMLADTGHGLAAVALMNGPGSPKAITGFAVQAIAAGLSGGPVPEAPPIPDPERIEDARRFAGTFRSEDGTMSLVADGAELWVEVDGLRGRLARTSPGSTTFHAGHPDLRDALVEIEVAGAEVVAVAHGRRRFVADPPAGAEVAAPEGWAAFEGLYRTHSPWQPAVRFVRRGGLLLMVDPGSGETEALERTGDATFQVASDDAGPPAPGSIRFARVIDGQALVAEIDGLEHHRSFDPPSVWREGSE